MKIDVAVHTQGVDLAYLPTGISGVFLGCFEFGKSVFFWVLVIAAVFLGCQINAVFLSVLHF